MPVSMLPQRHGRVPSASIDIFIAANESPTGHAIRFRRRMECADLEGAKTLAMRIEAALRTSGKWTPEQLPRQDLPKPEPITLEQVDTRTLQPPGGRALADALRLAWECPHEGWSRLKEGRKEYKRAAECVRMIGEGLPCARVRRENYEALEKAFAQRGMKPGVIQQRLQAFYRVLHFAERENWIAGRPKLKRGNVYKKEPVQRTDGQARREAVERRARILARMATT